MIILFYTVLNHCIYNIADRKSLKKDTVKITKADITMIKKKVQDFGKWTSIIVHNTIGVVSDKEQVHQVSLIQ